MKIETLFLTQIATIVSFFVALFILYRVLVSTKDSTIQLLKEKSDLLQLQLEQAKNISPDVLVENISKRAEHLTNELKLLNEDKNKNEEIISSKEEDLHQLRIKLQDFGKQIEKASFFFCPHCNAPMVYQLSVTDYMEDDKGRPYDLDHEVVSFECGLSFADDVETGKCSNANLQ